MEDNDGIDQETRMGVEHKRERKEALDDGSGKKALAATTNQAAQQGSALPRYCNEWPDKEDGIAKNLSRPCPMHLRNGRWLEEQIKISCWRFETGASHDKCPICRNGMHSAAHLAFECPKVAINARAAYCSFMESQFPSFQRAAGAAEKLRNVLNTERPAE